MRKALILILLATVCCTRRPLSDTECPGDNQKSAALEVSVDWSATGYDIYSEEEFIHRVSFRFFPKNGDKPFDRFLEDNVESGVIEVPAGEYSVVVFNESIDDVYWQGAIEFENVDDYSLFAAVLADEDRETYDFFYTPLDDEALSVEALILASSSIDNIVVSEAMTTTPQSSWSEEELAMISQLNPVVPRRLTCNTTIEVVTENLKSAYQVHASLSSLAQRVFMASGDTDSATTTHIGELTQWSWDDEQEKLHGTISESRLTFSTAATDQQHILTLDVLLIDGTRHTPDEPLVYDVSDQILSTAAATRYADNDLGASVSLSLPDVSGDIEVDPWSDDNEVTIF
ncbi:MAG: DUF5119 domain-containing protein [Rikenellaceae bacterium]